MNKTVYRVSKMDCPSEERLIRMKLDGMEEIQNLQFDIPNRKLTVIHTNNSDLITDRIDELKLDSKLVESSEYKEPFLANNISQSNQNEEKVL